MKMRDVQEKLSLALRAGAAGLDAEVTGGYTADF